MAIKKGDKIKVEYEGKLEDGTVFDSSEKHGNPLEFEIGAKQVIKGFEDAVIGRGKRNNLKAIRSLWRPKSSISEKGSKRAPSKRQGIKNRHDSAYETSKWSTDSCKDNRSW